VYDSDALFAEVTGRARRGATRGSVGRPTGEMSGRVVLTPLPLLRLESFGRFETGEALTATNGEVTAALSPAGFLTLFGGATFGSTLLPIVTTTPADGEASPALAAYGLLPSEVAGIRAGGEVVVGVVRAGGAFFSSGPATSVPFGLIYDREAAPIAVSAAAGFEAYAHLPLLRRQTQVSVDGWYTRWFDDVERPYTPVDLGRLALVVQGVYFGGQLEPIARIEAVRHGGVLVPVGLDMIGAAMQPFNQLNASLQIRIMDLQAFLLWDNLLQVANALPGGTTPPPFPRVVYGARWRFRN
jgi:hypothetical protein